MKEAVIAPGSDVRLLALGDTAWTVEFGEVIDPVVHARVQGLAEALDKRRETAGKGQGEGGRTPYAAVVDVVPTFRSLTVHFEPEAVEAEALHLSVLTTGVLKPAVVEAPVAATPASDAQRTNNMRDLEREHILETLAAVGGSRKLASEKLGMSERTLRHKLKQYREAGLFKE